MEVVEPDVEVVEPDVEVVEPDVEVVELDVEVVEPDVEVVEPGQNKSLQLNVIPELLEPCEGCYPVSLTNGLAIDLLEVGDNLYWVLPYYNETSFPGRINTWNLDGEAGKLPSPVCDPNGWGDGE